MDDTHKLNEEWLEFLINKNDEERDIKAKQLFYYEFNKLVDNYIRKKNI